MEGRSLGWMIAGLLVVSTSGCDDEAPAPEPDDMAATDADGGDEPATPESASGTPEPETPDDDSGDDPTGDAPATTGDDPTGADDSTTGDETTGDAPDETTGEPPSEEYAMCIDMATDECETCACDNCLSSLTACEADAGCIAIRDCARQADCTGIECLGPCGGVIDEHGGVFGPAAGLASALSDCYEGSCPGC